jgi:multidrug efflux pump subunit AcrB
VSAEDERAPRTVAAERPPSTARPERTLFIRRYPEDGQPGNQGDAVRVRLDLDRLRAEGLAMDDLMKAFEGCSVIDAHAPPRPNPPPGVLYEASLARPEVYGMLILKVTPEEGIVRLKDVATVELVAGREAQETEVVAAPGGGHP